MNVVNRIYTESVLIVKKELMIAKRHFKQNFRHSKCGGPHVNARKAPKRARFG